MKYWIGLTLAGLMLTGCADDYMYRDTEHRQVRPDTNHHDSDRTERRDGEHDERHD